MYSDHRLEASCFYKVATACIVRSCAAVKTCGKALEITPKPEGRLQIFLQCLSIATIATLETRTPHATYKYFYFERSCAIMSASTA